MKAKAKLTIEMKVTNEGVEARVEVDSDKKTYFFPFNKPYHEASRINSFISSLPKQFYVDALFERKKNE
jgi:hypothetical protein